MIRLFLAASLTALTVAGCGYYYVAGPLRPVDDQGAAMEVGDDGSVTFSQGRFEVKVRPLTDEELNRQLAGDSRSGPKSTNPFTYGDTEIPPGESQTRFTVFHVSVKNYAYPKVRIDPARIELRATNGREYWSLDVQQLDNYYRIYAIGYQGNAYSRYRERLDVLRRSLFRNEEIFSGQEVEGYLVFPALHHDVEHIDVIIHEAVVRFDYRNEPVETVDIALEFERDVGLRYPHETAARD